MARYLASKKLSKDTKKEMNDLDWALYRIANSRRSGVDILTFMNEGRPYKDRHGHKSWASVPRILGSVKKLVKLDAIYECGRGR